jgi:hypothetical protein
MAARFKQSVERVMEGKRELGDRFREVVEEAMARVDARVLCIMIVFCHGGRFNPTSQFPEIIGPEETESVTYVSPTPLGVCNISGRSGSLVKDLKLRINQVIRQAGEYPLTTDSVFAPLGKLSSEHSSIGHSLIKFRKHIADQPTSERDVLFKTLGLDTLTWTKLGIPLPNVIFKKDADPQKGDQMTIHCAYSSPDFNPENENPHFDHHVQGNWFDTVPESRRPLGSYIFLSEIITKFNQQKQSKNIPDGVMMIFSLACTATEWRSGKDSIVHKRTGERFEVSSDGTILDQRGQPVDPIKLNLLHPRSSLSLKKRKPSKLSREEVAIYKPYMSSQVGPMKARVKAFNTYQRKRDKEMLDYFLAGESEDESGFLKKSKQTRKRKRKSQSKNKIK